MEQELENEMGCIPKLELGNEMSENEMKPELENAMSWNPMSGKGLLLHS